jgi:hypothetical protein
MFKPEILKITVDLQSALVAETRTAAGQWSSYACSQHGLKVGFFKDGGATIGAATGIY